MIQDFCTAAHMLNKTIFSSDEWQVTLFLSKSYVSSQICEEIIEIDVFSSVDQILLQIYETHQSNREADGTTEGSSHFPTAFHDMIRFQPNKL